MSAITLINMTNATLISRDAATVTGSMDVVRPNQYGCCKPSITFFQLKCSCITIIIIHSSYLIAYNISCEYTKKKCFKTYVSWSSFFFRDHAVACFSLSRIKLKQSSCRTLQTGHAIVTTRRTDHPTKRDKELQATKREQQRRHTKTWQAKHQVECNRPTPKPALQTTWPQRARSGVTPLNQRF